MINIKDIWENQIDTPANIVRTRIAHIQNVDCFAATNQLINRIFFILSIDKNTPIPDLRNYKFQGVEFYVIIINDRVELNIYLMNNDLLDIFSLFIEDLLYGMDEQKDELGCVIHILNKASKWKLLFDRLGNHGLSNEKQKGLLGELLFLQQLLENKETFSSAVHSWISMDLELNSKDFVFETTAVEIKFTSSSHPKVNISSKTQLELTEFSNLYLVVYFAQSSLYNGVSINSLVDFIRNKLGTQNERDNFNRKLNIIGYFDNDRDLYNQYYIIKNNFIYIVDKNFPKLTSENTSDAICDVQYSIEISAIDQFKTTRENLFLSLKR